LPDPLPAITPPSRSSHISTILRYYARSLYGSGSRVFTDITGENYAHSCAFIRLIAGDRRGSIRFRSWPRFRLCHTGEFAGGVEFRRRNVRAECYVRLAAHGADDGELRLHAPPSVFIDRPRTRAARIVADDHDVGRRRVPNQFGVAFSSSA